MVIRLIKKNRANPIDINSIADPYPSVLRLKLGFFIRFIVTTPTYIHTYAP